MTDNQKREIHDLTPDGEARDLLTIAHEISDLIEPMTDHGFGTDSGVGFGAADLHPVIGGWEYHVRITRTKERKTPDPVGPFDTNKSAAKS